MAVVLTRAAIRGLRGLPRREAGQIAERLEAIGAAPLGRHSGVTAVQGEPPGRFRVRQGDWRAVFVVEGEDVVVLAIGHRREVYN